MVKIRVRVVLVLVALRLIGRFLDDGGFMIIDFFGCFVGVLGRFVSRFDSGNIEDLDFDLDPDDDCDSERGCGRGPDLRTSCSSSPESVS